MMFLRAPGVFSGVPGASPILTGRLLMYISDLHVCMHLLYAHILKHLLKTNLFLHSIRLVYPRAN